MIPDPNDIGKQLGSDGVNNVLDKAEQYCTHEAHRIKLCNLPEILALKAEMPFLCEQKAALEDRLRFAPSPGGLRHQQRRKIYAWSIAALLTVSTFAFAVLTFEPFRLGWKSYLYCLGIAVVLPFLVERLLEGQRGQRIARALVVVAALAGIGSLMLLAIIRSDLFAQQVQSAPTVVIDDSQPAPETPNTFYGSTVGLLRLATVLLAFAMELGGGLALSEAWTSSADSSENWAKLREELSIVQLRMVGLVRGVTLLENEPALFTHKFWRDFHGSMITQAVRNAMNKMLVLAVALMLASHAHAASPQHLNLVVAIDLSKSVAAKGPDGTTEFQKNVDGVTRLLAQVSADTRVTIVGITDRSFAQPYILLSATVPSDPGYFGERLSVARTQLVQSWKRRSVSLQPVFPATDVLGALLLASQIFQQQSIHIERSVLVLFSDMRNSTAELNLESPLGHPSNPVPIDLHQAEVFALGVDGAGLPTTRWHDIERFWSSYLHDSSASLRAFSVLRSLSEQEMK